MSTHATVLTLISILSLLSRCVLICKDSSKIKLVRNQTKKGAETRRYSGSQPLC